MFKKIKSQPGALWVSLSLTYDLSGPTCGGLEIFSVQLVNFGKQVGPIRENQLALTVLGDLNFTIDYSEKVRVNKVLANCNEARIFKPPAMEPFSLIISHFQTLSSVYTINQ